MNYKKYKKLHTLNTKGRSLFEFNSTKDCIDWMRSNNFDGSFSHRYKQIFVDNEEFSLLRKIVKQFNLFSEYSTKDNTKRIFYCTQVHEM